MTKEEALSKVKGCLTDLFPFEEYDEVEEIMKALEKEPKWIPVTETTLPEEGKVVVACGDKGTWDYGTYRGHYTDIHMWNWKKNTIKHVYWWMYKEDALPKPYEPQESEGRRG